MSSPCAAVAAAALSSRFQNTASHGEPEVLRQGSAPQGLNMLSALGLQGMQCECPVP